MSKFQYKIIDRAGQPILESTLNKLGDDGWELVTAMEYETDDVKYYFHYILKRLKPEEAEDE